MCANWKILRRHVFRWKKGRLISILASLDGGGRFQGIDMTRGSKRTRRMVLGFRNCRISKDVLHCAVSRRSFFDKVSNVLSCNVDFNSFRHEERPDTVAARQMRTPAGECD